MAFLIYHIRYVLPHLRVPRLVLGFQKWHAYAPFHIWHISTFGLAAPSLHDPSTHGTSGPGGLQPRALLLPPFFIPYRWNAPLDATSSRTNRGPTASSDQQRQWSNTNEYRMRCIEKWSLHPVSSDFLPWSWPGPGFTKRITHVASHSLSRVPASQRMHQDSNKGTWHIYIIYSILNIALQIPAHSRSFPASPGPRPLPSNRDVGQIANDFRACRLRNTRGYPQCGDLLGK